MFYIPEFDITEKIAALKPEEASDFVHNLKLFAENFPEAEKGIKYAFEVKDYTCFSRCLESLKETFVQIYANDLALECDRLLRIIGDESPDMNSDDTEAQITDFLSMLLMFSIDINMVVYREENAQLKKSANEDLRSTSDLPEKTQSDKDKIILAVDDNPFFLTALKNALSGTDYKLICVSSPSAALKYLEKQKPNLYILDIEMPEMNGYDLAVKIREKEAAQLEQCPQQMQWAPIIFMTGNSAQEYVLKAIKAGAADFIVKPISQKLVLAKIRKYI